MVWPAGDRTVRRIARNESRGRGGKHLVLFAPSHGQTFGRMTDLRDFSISSVSCRPYQSRDSCKVSFSLDESQMTDLRKLDSIDALRTEYNSAPQLKLRIASAIAEILSDYGLRATGSVLGSLSFASDDELEKMGSKAPQGRRVAWTI